MHTHTVLCWRNTVTHTDLETDVGKVTVSAHKDVSMAGFDFLLYSVTHGYV